MNDQKTYSHADIQRYLQHKMSAADMHAFEKAMMDDPFLADAIEGYKTSDESLADKHLKQIESQLIRSEEKTKVVAMPARRNDWWKAAAIVFFIVTAALSFLLFNNSANNDLAQATNTKTQEVTSADSTPSNTSTSNQNTITEMQEQPLAKNSAPKVPNPENSLANNGEDEETKQSPGLFENDRAKDRELSDRMQKPVQRTEMAAKQSEFKEKSTLAAASPSVASKPRTNATTRINAYDLANTEASPATLNESLQGRVAGVNKNIARQKTSGSVQNEIKGRVTDVSGKPIAYATIATTKTNRGTSSDEAGNFVLNDADSSVEVVVSSVGYSAETARIDSRKASNNITLKKGNGNLSEVVVTGYGSQKKRDMTGSTTTISKKEDAPQQSPEPKTGWENFDEYVNKAVGQVKDSSATSVYDKEDVVLEFSIDKKGRPVDITIVRTGTRSDALQAINILKKGPLWNSTIKGARVVYTFNFKR